MTDVEMEDNPVPEPKRQSIAPIIDEARLKTYYGWLFPAEAMCKWLAYENDDEDHSAADDSYLKRREFAFVRGTWLNRYLSFQDAKAFARALVKDCPDKIDIGAVYSIDPRKKLDWVKNQFLPRERELVFDIDMDGYDDIRTCCQEGKMCSKDWAYMAAVIDAFLRQDFGFEHILWVYSGRRGIHCWVCDKRARVLSDRPRGNVTDFLTVYKGKENGMPALTVSNCSHPSIKRALQICKEIWTERILPEQRLFESETHTEAIYKQLEHGVEPGHQNIEQGVNEAWRTHSGEHNKETWNLINKEVDKLKSSARHHKRYQQLLNNMDKILLTYTYPRLDVNVSKHMNHLLKAPFSVHPKSGRISVPIDVDKLWEFNPDNVPSLEQITHQLEEEFRTDKRAGVECTALHPYIVYFQEFINRMTNSNRLELNQVAK